jgi:predicted nucleic acid-binding protein
MYLIDTNVLSERRKEARCNPGVQQFFRDVSRVRSHTYLSVVTIGELRRGIDLVRYHGDVHQADRLEQWFVRVVTDFADNILMLDADICQVWGRLRVPHPENALDKQIAATALVHDLTLVTRNERGFLQTGVKVLNPFLPGSGAAKE